MQLKLLLSILFIGVYNIHCHGRTRGKHSKYNLYQDSCSCSCDDLGSLFNLARVLDDKDSHMYPPPENTASNFNAEDLIMKLINALIDLTKQTAKNSCHCPHSSNVHNGGSQLNVNPDTPAHSAGSVANGNPSMPVYNAGSSNNGNFSGPAYNSGSLSSVNSNATSISEDYSTNIIPSRPAYNEVFQSNTNSKIPTSNNVHNISFSYTNQEGVSNNSGGGDIHKGLINKDFYGLNENNNIVNYNVAGHPYGIGIVEESQDSLINNNSKDTSSNFGNLSGPAYNTGLLSNFNTNESTISEHYSTNIIPSRPAYNDVSPTNVNSNILNNNIHNFSSSYTNQEGGSNNFGGGDKYEGFINKELLGSNETNNIVNHDVAGHPYGVDFVGETKDSLINNVTKDSSSNNGNLSGPAYNSGSLSNFNSNSSTISENYSTNIIPSRPAYNDVSSTNVNSNILSFNNIHNFSSNYTNEEGGLNNFGGGDTHEGFINKDFYGLNENNNDVAGHLYGVGIVGEMQDSLMNNVTNDTSSNNGNLSGAAYNSGSLSNVNSNASTISEDYSTNRAAYNDGSPSDVNSNILTSNDILNFSSGYTNQERGSNNSGGGDIHEGFINKANLESIEHDNIINYNVAGHPYGVGMVGGSQDSLINNISKDTNKEVIINSGINVVTNNGTNSGEGMSNLEYLMPRKQDKTVELDVADQNVHSVEKENAGIINK